MTVATPNAAGRRARQSDRGESRGDLTRIQRARMIAALAEGARERGVAALTVADVVARSGVSRRTFYEHFEDRDDCFRAAFDEAVVHAAQRVLPAYRDGGDWRGRMRAGLRALLEFLEDEPDLGALCVVDALGAGPQALARRAEVLDVLIDAVNEGDPRPPRLTAEGVVGAVLGVVHARLTRERMPQMVGLLGPLMGMVVLPYRGAAVAAREAARPAPTRRRAVQPGRASLRELDMRLTYRTVRVLVAIAGQPGASNRQVAEAAGVHDQGQISKLLARLEHIGLIGKDGAGVSRGEPNAWRLTERGEQLEQVIRRQGDSDRDCA